MGGGHPVAPVVIDAADQQGLGFGARGRVIVALLVELGLHGVKEITIEDGGLLAGQDLAFENHLAEVEPIAQKMGEGTAGERDPTNRAPGLERSHLGDDPSLTKVGHQQVEAAKLQIPPEDGSNPFGFFFHYDDLAVLGLISEWRDSANPEALADIATLSPPVFATSLLKNVVPGGMTIISDNFQDGRPGYAQNTFFVLDEPPIQTSRDLKGKKVAINAFGSSVDLALRVKLKKDGIDPRRDLAIVEVAFPNQAAAIRERRVDCGVLLQPFMTIETRKGGLRPLFTGGDALGTYSVVFQVATNDFLKKNSDAVKSFLADYVRGLQWFYAPGNRQKAIEMTAAFTKLPAELIDSYFVTNRDYYRDPNGCVGNDAIQKPIDAMHSEGLIDRPVKIADHVNMSYLPHPCST